MAQPTTPEVAKAPEGKEEELRGFGTIKGVFVPSILTILGVIMYLRLGWVVGNVGLLGAIAIITMASFITFLTGLSIASTATNMHVKGGGAYFMVSRSFGLEAGAAIGLPLFLAQATGVSFYIAGFSESLSAIFPNIPIQSIGFVCLIALSILAFVSADLALKAQFLILAVIIASLISFTLGIPGMESTPIDVDSLPSASFWVVFAVFFPAVTGIEAGISMSGDLKNPSKSLPLGTIAAVIVGYLVYVVLAILLNNGATSDELKSNPMIIKDLAINSHVIYAGIWGATLSSALGALLGAPRTLQALANDDVVPRFLGKGYGDQNDPRIATGVTFLIAAFGITLGNLDVIAPVLSMFFLTSYGALNLISGVEGMIGNPSWRPTFQTPWGLSLIASFFCFATMLMINPGATLIALACSFGLYLIMRKRRLQAPWSDMRRAILLFLARSSIYQLADYEDDARTWRPNILALTGSPKSRWHLVELADAMTHGKGFLTIATVVKQAFLEDEKVKSKQKGMKEFLKKNNVPALVKVRFGEDFVEQVEGLLGGYGIGPIQPNTILFGESKETESFVDFAQIIKSAFFSKKNVLLVKNENSSKISISVYSKRKRIDVWWGRQNNNANLMLVLAYMIQTSPEWIGSELTLKSLVRSEDEQKGVLENLREYVKSSRIEADVEVYVDNGKEIPLEQIKNYSASADLVFIGLRPPNEGESAQDYSEYYERILQNTEEFPMTIITLAGEPILFKDIFT